MTECPMPQDSQSSYASSNLVSLPPHPLTNSQMRGAQNSVSILLLDGVALHVHGRRMALSNRKAAALIAYLALTPGKRETRDRLVGLFWSASEPAKARASLRQVLYGLRKTFNKDHIAGLSIGRLHVSLDASAFATDLDHAFASIDQGNPLDLLANDSCVTDVLLRDCDDIDPSFNTWLQAMRERVRQQLIRKLEAQLMRAPYGMESTKRIARTLLQIDPTHEVACQHLMRAHVASGNTGAALTAYKQLWEHLEQEYDIEPSAATQELLVAIRLASRALSGDIDIARSLSRLGRNIGRVAPRINLSERRRIS